MAKTPDTHYTEPLDKLTFGKRFYVIDDEKHVWAADETYDDAVRVREKVAGNLWSKTPAVRPMPPDAKVCAKLKSLVRGPDGASTAAKQPTQEAADDLEQALAELPPPAPTNGSGQAPQTAGADDATTATTTAISKASSTRRTVARRTTELARYG